MQALALLGRRALQRGSTEGWLAMSHIAVTSLPESRCSDTVSTTAPPWGIHALGSTRTQYTNPFRISTRQYAGPAGDTTTGIRLDYAAVTLGYVKDSYQIKPALSNVFFLSKEGWRDAYRRFQEWLVLRGVLLNKARQCIVGFSKHDFMLLVAELYRDINNALAQDDVSQLQSLHRVLGQAEKHRMQDEVERRLMRGQYVEWSLEGGAVKPQDITIVQGRMDKLHPKMQSLFLQFTVRIASKQRFALRNRRGELLAGDPDKVIDVVDYWVLERKILEPVQQRQQEPPNARWRVVQRISMQPSVQQDQRQHASLLPSPEERKVQQQTRLPQESTRQTIKADQQPKHRVLEHHDKQQRSKQRHKQQDKQGVAWSSAYKPGAC